MRKISMLILVSIFMAAGCKPKPSDGEKESVSDDQMELTKKILTEEISINGAGASFPNPLYARWAHSYNQAKGTRVNYQSIGSGGGIAQIKAKTVDFGGSDAPMKAEELDEFSMVQFPTVMGGVVPILNIDGIKPGAIKITGEILADIYLGKIKKWNHPRLQELNKDANLPNMDISVVHRADGSGTTWIFTNYLNKVSKEWEDKVGSSSAVSWPTGIGGKGNEGVASYVQRVKGAIGYVEFAYALQNKLSHLKLENADGNFVDPTIDSFQAAAASADWTNAPGFYMVLTQQPGKESWPITGATFILMHKEQADETVGKEVLNFFNWCYENGNNEAVELHYVPMPDSVIAQIRDMWKKQIKANGKPLWE